MSGEATVSKASPPRQKRSIIKANQVPTRVSIKKKVAKGHLQQCEERHRIQKQALHTEKEHLTSTQSPSQVSIKKVAEGHLPQCEERHQIQKQASTIYRKGTSDKYTKPHRRCLFEGSWPKTTFQNARRGTRSRSKHYIQKRSIRQVHKDPCGCLL